MPLYDLSCRSCGNQFEARTGPDDPVACPACGSTATDRLFTGFSGPFTVGRRGAEARSSDAARRAREERRRERREARKQQES